MNKKIILALALILVTILSAGVYFVLNQQKPLSPQAITNFEECAKVYPVGESYPGQCWTPDGGHFVQDIERRPFLDLTPITVSGEMACLTKIGQGTQTMECAIGLKETDGRQRQYELKNLFKVDSEYKFSVVGLRVEVSGIFFNSEEIKGPDGNKYDVVGVIDVTSIKEIGN